MFIKYTRNIRMDMQALPSLATRGRHTHLPVEYKRYQNTVQRSSKHTSLTTYATTANNLPTALLRALVTSYNHSSVAITSEEYYCLFVRCFITQK